MNKRVGKRRGSLGGVLVILTLLAMTAALVLESTTFQQRSIHRFYNEEHALEMARSAVVRAYAEIAKKRTYGQAGEKLEVTFSELEGENASGTVTFDVKEAKTLGLPYSINNAQREASVTGYGGMIVPASCIQLIGYGKYRNATRIYSAMLAVPPWDFALSSSGTIRSEGGLLLGALKEGRPVGSVKPEDLQATGLVCNGQDDAEGKALKLTGDVELYGELRSVGGIEIPENARGVSTQVANAKAQELPSMDVHKYDPESRPSLQRLSKDAYDQKTLTGFSKYTGRELTFSQGLTLEHGLLYVDGDLIIDGPLSGSGAVFCTGKVTMRGGGALSADNQAAVVAQGDVRILWSGAGRSSFRGMIYTGGQGGFPDQPVDQDLVVRDVTVQGCVVNAGKGSAGTGSSMTLKDAKVIYEGQATQLILEPGFSGTWPIPVGGGRTGGPPGSLSLRMVTRDGKTFTPGPAYFAGRGTPLGAADFVFTDDSGHTYEAAADGTVPRELADAYDGPARSFSSSWQSEIDTAKQDTASHGIFKLDLNEFLQEEGRLKVVMRKLD